MRLETGFWLYGHVISTGQRFLSVTKIQFREGFNRCPEPALFHERASDPTNLGITLPFQSVSPSDRPTERMYDPEWVEIVDLRQCPRQKVTRGGTLDPTVLRPPKRKNLIRVFWLKIRDRTIKVNRLYVTFGDYTVENLFFFCIFKVLDFFTRGRGESEWKWHQHNTHYPSRSIFMNRRVVHQERDVDEKTKRSEGLRLLKGIPLTKVLLGLCLSVYLSEFYLSFSFPNLSFNGMVPMR